MQGCVRLVSMNCKSPSEAITEQHENESLALELNGANFKFISSGTEPVLECFRYWDVG